MLEEKEKKSIHFTLAEKDKKYIRLLQIGLVIAVVGIIFNLAVKGFAPKEPLSTFSGVKVLPQWAVSLVSVGSIIFIVGIMIILSSLFSLALVASGMHVYMRIALIIAFALVLLTGIIGIGIIGYTSVYVAVS